MATGRSLAEVVDAAALRQDVTLPHDATRGELRDPAHGADRALAVVRPTGPGTITVTASAAGCGSVATTVRAQ